MLALDHIVIAAAGPGMDGNGLRVIPGGVHPNWGTANELAFLKNDCYVEWLYVREAERANRSDNLLIQHLVRELVPGGQAKAFQLAFRTDNMSRFVEHFERNGISYVGPLHGSRQKPDGTMLAWQMVFPVYDMQVETLPFLIQWEQPVHERVRAEDITDAGLAELHIGMLTAERLEKVYQLERVQTIPDADVFPLENTLLHITKNGTISFTIV